MDVVDVRYEVRYSPAYAVGVAAIVDPVVVPAELECRSTLPGSRSHQAGYLPFFPTLQILSVTGMVECLHPTTLEACPARPLVVLVEKQPVEFSLPLVASCLLRL